MDHHPQAQTAGLRQATPRAYPPSFMDRFMGGLQRLPAPYWLTVLALFVLESLALLSLAWLTGWLPFFSLDPIVFLFPVWLWGTIAIMIHLNAVAREALAGFRPLLALDDAEFQQLEYEFTTMPARDVLLNSGFWIVTYGVLNYVTWAGYAAYGIRPTFVPILVLAGLLSFSTGSAIYYHSLRQLRLVNRTVRLVNQFSLFRLDPVYAFSRLTARTGIAWMILLSLTVMLFPLQMTNGPILAILLMQVGLAGAAFVLPLWFVHQRLVAEKRRLLAELDQRVEAVLGRLHQCVDERQLDRVGPFSNTLTSLNAEREVLLRIPTWPWRAGTLTSFLSAIGLPIMIFLIQMAIEAWVGWSGR